MNVKGNRNRCDYERCYGQRKHRQGLSSFWMHDPDVVFDALELKEGDFFLDLGCGPGDYAIEASRIVGDYGTVYALDKWQHLVDVIIKKADYQGLRNIKAMIFDINDPLPIKNNRFDICFMATVLHIPAVTKKMGAVFNEVRRVLKPDGRFVIIECKKEDQPFGPPKHMRLSPQDVEDSVVEYGFEKVGLVDLGYNYMIQFAVK